MHRGKVILTCDIEHKNKIIFRDIDIDFWADIHLHFGRYEDDIEIEMYENLEDYVSSDARDGYMYTLVLKEYGAPKEFEDYLSDLPYEDFTLLVKSEDFQDVEIDYDMFEPDWDMMREGK
jgi:hypothetical protein